MAQLKRQLAAIVFTDIVGYASLMRNDERRASEIRRRHRAVFDTLTPKHGGRMLQYYGDGTLSIFSSSVAAVECAVEMQRAFGQDPRVPLRIGIHTGDIAYDDIDIFGDVVNVAARVEPCCVPGGIFITGKVYDDIKNHEWLSARDLGAFTFKGMDEPLRLYAVDNEGIAVPGEDDILNLGHSQAKLVSITPAPQRPAAGLVPEKVRQVALLSIPVLLLGLIVLTLTNRAQSPRLFLTLPESGRSSIAVLPFDNISEENNDYFSDGITEDILTLLSHIDSLKVVSRTSVMRYKDQEKKDLREIGRELNVDHILEGSVRRDGNKVRITAQLIDARSDDHIWAKTYDREVTKIFDVQSQVAQDIAAALSKTLSDRERAVICKKPTEDIEAYEHYLQGRKLYSNYTPRDNDRAIALFRRALDADPAFALAYAGLGDALAQKAFANGMDELLLDSAIQVSKKAIELDRELSEGYKALGLAYHYRGMYDQALEEYRKAVERNQNNDMALNNIGAIYQEQGRLVEAIRWARRALSLNPRHAWSMHNLARMYYAVGDDERALAMIKQGLDVHPDFRLFQELLAAYYLRQPDLTAAKEYGLRLMAEHADQALGYQVLGEVSLFEGNLKDARAFFAKAERIAEKSGAAHEKLDNALNIAYIDLADGNAVIGRTQLRALINQLNARAERTQKPGYFVALSMAHNLLGEKEASLRWLELAARHKWLDYRWADRHPFFASLRQNPRFRELLRGVEKRAEGMREEIRVLEGEEQMI
jgi:TolB-like protein/class 3 adenylate cyclase/predicted Zn-dependent protease